MAFIMCEGILPFIVPFIFVAEMLFVYDMS